MKNIAYALVKPALLSQEVWEEIVQLHQRAFSFSREQIIQLLKEREEVLLYRERRTGRLIGTVGCSIFSIPPVIVLYMGNVVIDPAHKTSGLFLHGQFTFALRAILKYPFKKKFVCGLLMTPESHQWAEHFPTHWPDEKGRTPPACFRWMEKLAVQLAGQGNYFLDGEKIIVTRIPDRPQLLMAGPIHFRNFAAVLFLLLKHKIKNGVSL